MRTIDIEKEEQTRTEIVSAAQQLFQKYGLEKTTMEDIASATGKGKSTLYYYYKSKEDAFCAVLDKETMEVKAAIDAAIAIHKSPSEQLKAFFLTRFHEVKTRINLYSVMISENVKQTSLFNRIRKENNTDEINVIKKILVDGINAGEFRSISEEDCHNIALVSVMMSRGLDANIILSGRLPPPEIRLETTVDIFIRGLR